MMCDLNINEIKGATYTHIHTTIYGIKLDGLGERED